MVRRTITDSIWKQLEDTMHSKDCHKWKNDRNIMEVIIWKLRTGAPWRDVPQELCPWKTAYNRFNRWQQKVYGILFFKLRGEVDKEWVFADGSYVRAHQYASGARSGEERAIGRSRGGLTKKIHICADAHGNLINFEITGGEVHDSKVAAEMIDMVKGSEYWIADKGYDSEDIRDKARAAGMVPIIP